MLKQTISWERVFKPSVRKESLKLIKQTISWKWVFKCRKQDHAFC